MKEFFEITCPVNSEDIKMFMDVVNLGIDGHLEAFTKSIFETKLVDGFVRHILKFHRDELHILLRRLRELDTEQSQQWAEDIQRYAYPKYGRIVFLQGEEAQEAFDELMCNWEDAIIYLKQWDQGEYHDIHDEPAAGTADKVVQDGEYILTYNTALDYIGLEIEIYDD